MSTINIPTAQTVPGQITTPQPSASVEALYGPWENIDLNDFSWMDLSFPYSDHDNFIGLTIGVKSSDGKKVTEYQLEKQDENFVFVKKGSDFLLTNDVVNQPLTINSGKISLQYGNTLKTNSDRLLAKTISEGNGTGIVSADLLGEITSSNAYALVYYSAGSVMDRGIEPNHLYIKKSDLENWFNPTYTQGAGIKIAGNTIQIDYAGHSGQFLKAKEDGIEWANPASSSIELSENGGLAFDNNGRLKVDIPNGSGYLKWNGAKFLIGAEPLGGSVQVADPVTLSGQNITLINTDFVDGITSGANPCYVYGYNYDHGSGLRWYTYQLPNFELVNNSFKLKLASDLLVGGILAETHDLDVEYILVERDGNLYYEKYIIDNGSLYKPIHGNFVGAECVLTNSLNETDFEDGRLYANLTEFVSVDTPTSSCVPVKCAQSGNADAGIVEKQFYVDLSVAVGNGLTDTNKVVFLYSTYKPSVDNPSVLEGDDLADFQLMRRRFLDDQQTFTTTEYDIQALDADLTLLNIEKLYLDPTTAKVSMSQRYSVILDLSTATEDCEFITYTSLEFTASGLSSDEFSTRFTKLYDTLRFKKNNKFLITFDRLGSRPSGCYVTIEPVRTLRDFLYELS